MSVFAKAKETTAKGKKDAEAVLVKGKAFDTTLTKWKKLHEAYAKTEAMLNDLRANLMEIAEAKYREKFQATGAHPGSIKLQSITGATCLFGVQDRYKVMDGDQAEMINEALGAEVIEKVETYSFDKDVLATHFEKISAALDGLEIPEEDKAKLLKCKIQYTAKKGTVHLLNTFPGGVDASYELVQPVSFLKNS